MEEFEVFLHYEPAACRVHEFQHPRNKEDDSYEECTETPCPRRELGHFPLFTVARVPICLMSPYCFPSILKLGGIFFFLS